MLPILALATLILVAECYFLGRKAVFPILLALAFALFITGFHHYEYLGVQNIYWGSFNLYPMVCWTAGLLAIKIVYDRVSMPYKFFILSASYLGVLFLLEYVAYQWLGVRTAGNYPSLLGLGIIHGPPLIHWFYVLAGPLYIALLRAEALMVSRGAKILTAPPSQRK